MSAPAEWRFQWPDGTWIHWNPETEAWEKEESSEEPAEEAAATIDGAPPHSKGTEDDHPRDDEIGLAEPDPKPLSTSPARRAAHPSTANVISRDEEEEEEKRSLKPTIFAGAVVGLAVGLAVSAMLR